MESTTTAECAAIGNEEGSVVLNDSVNKNEDLAPASANTLLHSSMTNPVTPQKQKASYNVHDGVCMGSNPLPPTPDQTPTKGTKRPTTDDPADSPFLHTAKCQKLSEPRPPSKSILRKISTPKFSILRKRATSPPKLSADELKRTGEAILSQIDWHQVAEDVASNRAAAVYRKAFTGILQAKVHELSNDTDPSENSD